MPPLIELENVTIQQGRTVALDRVSLRIEDGEHVAILGPNGSGKSTLVKALTREVYPRAGDPGASLRIYGRERWDVFELRERLGIVTNDLVAQCTRRHSAFETVLSGFFGSIGVWPHHAVTPEMEERARGALRLLEIEHLADRPLVELSSGEARRAVFARARVHDPRALVFDEPSNSLDVRGLREVRGAMRKLARGGTSLVLVTHQLEDIVPEIGRVVTLCGGRVRHDGPKEEILRAGLLREVFGVDVEVQRAGDLYRMV
jgi:iron complex transport system ATP-binding protein